LKVTIYSNQLISPLAIARNTLQEALFGIVKTCTVKGIIQLPKKNI
jgi:hypothetical protein